MNFEILCISSYFAILSIIVNNRGALISKLTDIPITDILAIKSTDSDTDTDITTSMGSSLLLLQILQI